MTGPSARSRKTTEKEMGVLEFVSWKVYREETEGVCCNYGCRLGKTTVDSDRRAL